MSPEFSSEYSFVLERIERIDPIKYGETRNYIDGAVTYLSPYISRGVISTKQVLEQVLKRGHSIQEMESFVKELCWRDYFQRVAQHKNLNQEIKHLQHPVSNDGMPEAIVKASTGINGIDAAIITLYETGYMHNHCRMYTASLVCNIAKSHWLLPAKWMYFHLLDGDWASNACSWQWVAGANSIKKYVANQENINKYARTNQSGTFLDCSYEALAEIQTPEELLVIQAPALRTVLPENKGLEIDKSLPTLIYNYYNLDPNWRSDQKANRILLLEPSFFDAYPVSERCMDFMLSLTVNIPGIQIFTGDFDVLCSKYQLTDIYYKEHPLNRHYSGSEESRDWISENLTEYYPSFFAYWKKVEKELLLKYR